MNNEFRVPAVPLVTVDPYFSVWSGADNLYDDYTTHWTGARNGMTGLALIDGKAWRFMGRTEKEVEKDNKYFNRKEPGGMEQLHLEVKPLSSIYVFKGGGICLEIDFTTPLLMNDLEIMSRPVTYISFKAYSIDQREHKVQIYIDVTAEWCVNDSSYNEHNVVFQRNRIKDGVEDLFIGSFRQNILGKSGDNVRIDWGYLHLILPDLTNMQGVINSYKIRKNFILGGKDAVVDNLSVSGDLKEDMPVLAAVIDFGNIAETPVSSYIILAYDDIFSLEYFNEYLPAFWRRNGMTFEEMILKAISEYNHIMNECDNFNRKLYSSGIESGGEKYAQILALAYRQAIAAHKLVEDKEGNVLFISKECFSNGCAATVDVTYPSIPLFLLYNVELVKGMLRPIFRYATSGDWPYEFAPHDVGRYPKVNGQVYRLKREWTFDNSKGMHYAINKDASLPEQMPVEECGNMLITTAAICMFEKNAQFAVEFWDLLTQWAEYLVSSGFDPGMQLCTDDFTSKLAHNANLSVKAIMGIASYSLLCKMLGENKKFEEYLKIAKEMAGRWEELARDGDHYKLTFAQSNTWSLKYNMIWDDIFNLNLFPEKVKQKEVAQYIKMKNKYGTPLDSRDSITKADWLVWAAALAKDKNSFVELIEPLWDFLNETPSRVPFTDFYGTTDRLERSMHHRSVIGGVFIKLLKDKAADDNNF